MPLDRRLEEVAKAVGGGYCRLQLPLRLAFAVRETLAGHRGGQLPSPFGRRARGQGKGPAANSQWAPPAADHNTRGGHAQPPPSLCLSTRSFVFCAAPRPRSPNPVPPPPAWRSPSRCAAVQRCWRPPTKTALKSPPPRPRYLPGPCAADVPHALHTGCGVAPVSRTARVTHRPVGRVGASVGQRTGTDPLPAVARQPPVVGRHPTAVGDRWMGSGGCPGEGGGQNPLAEAVG